MKNQRLAHKEGQKGSGRKTRLQVLQPAELMSFLLDRMPEQSRSNIKSLLTRGQVWVDGEAVKQYNHPLQAGQEVMVNWSWERGQAADKGLPILYEDEDLIVVNKDAGLLSMSTSKENRHTAYAHLSEYVKQHDEDNKIFIVHRLDRETSGLMMFAKSAKIQEVLQKKWADAVLCRRYYALVEGYVEKEQNTIQTWLHEHPKSLKVYVSKPGEGVEATTHYKIIDGSRFYTLLDVELETGRKNQIRVHMQHMGHPVTGDAKYGAKRNPMKRLGLHAAELTFVHPVTRQTHSFKTAVPPAFIKTMQEE